MKQRHKPCPGCPFSPAVKAGETGGTDPLVYIGQSCGPFWLPCHADENYAGKASQAGVVSQCAGAAIFRKNIGVDRFMPEAMLHVNDRPASEAFASPEAFVAHHLQLTEAEAALCIHQAGGLHALLEKELKNANVRRVPVVDGRLQ